jgi:preprotein translocase subunit SecA
VAFLANIFDRTKREVARATRTVERINALRAPIAALTDAQMRAKTEEFKARLAKGETLDAILPEAFAVMREASWRVLGRRQYRFWIHKPGVAGTGTSAMDELIVPEGERDATAARLKQEGRTFEVERYMEPFDVQMVGGIILHTGMIAEMKTGEGKTLVAAAPLYLNALAGNGAHLVTVNDYLVRYQGHLMGELYHFLGLTTAVTQAGRGDGKLPAYMYDPGYAEPDGYPNMRPITRREAYRCDILYTTNNEVGFDYLRDNITMDQEQLSQRELNYAIVDEVDSILVDEARTPLIISGPGPKASDLYGKVDRVIRNLKAEIDYVVDEKSKNATLTEDGVPRVEAGLGVENIADPDNLEIFQHVTASLRAHACYRRDVDYIVKDGEVIIVDESTGRLMYGRRYSEGLHQAIEAKEGVKIERESQTWATVTFQNFFLLYGKLAGMTGTAKTEEQEFIETYGLAVAMIPTHRPVARADHADIVYKTEEAKFRGLMGEILQCESRQQPVLVGTRSIEVSERISERLKADLLQAYALATILYRHLRELRALNDRQRNEFSAILKLRAGDVRREREHLQGALEKMYSYQNQNAFRLVQPEEIRQIEMRLERTSALENDITTLSEKLRAGGNLADADARRLAEVVCFHRLEEIRSERLSKLMELCGLPGRADNEENVSALAQAIGLTSDLDRLRDLLQRGIPHRVLNAKYHEQEAHIIAQAGRPGAVTIATNMAGRGVDIMLGGNPLEMVDEILDERGINREEASDTDRAAALEEARARCHTARELVVSRGGLAIVGTERHESRRIDNQLRGRSGRQGDPGQSRFYVSLQDELMRLFGPERFELLNNSWEESEQIASKMISSLIERAQRKVEGHNFEMRKHVKKYDEEVNRQRKEIYSQRREVLMGEKSMRPTVEAAFARAVRLRVDNFAGDVLPREQWDLRGLGASLQEICVELPLFFAPPEMREGPSSPLLEQMHRQRIWQHYMDGLGAYRTSEALYEGIMAHLLEAYNARETFLGDETMRMLERLVILRIVDTRWMAHLDAVDFLKDGIGLRGYAQVDPIVAFTNEAHDMWLQLQEDILADIAQSVLRVRLSSEEAEHRRATQRRPIGTNRNNEGPSKGDRVAYSGVGRNDPCPCGSGRKFKMCHGTTKS